MVKPSDVFVLRKGDDVVAAFGNLKRLCEYGAEHYGSFPSYWTLTRKEMPLEFEDFRVDKVPFERSTFKRTNKED
jgi:hypothetical protein